MKTISWMVAVTNCVVLNSTAYWRPGGKRCESDFSSFWTAVATWSALAPGDW